MSFLIRSTMKRIKKNLSLTHEITGKKLEKHSIITLPATIFHYNPDDCQAEDVIKHYLHISSEALCRHHGLLPFSEPT